MDNNIKCTICNHNAVFYKEATFSHFSSNDVKITDSQYGKHWRLWRCCNCDLVYASPMPEEQYLTEQYRNMNDQDYSTEETGRKKNFSRLLTHLEKIMPARGSFLDIGAASGLLLELAKERGWEAEGIEPSTQLYQMGSTKDLTLYHTSIEEFNSPKKYTIITVIDVLEHLAKPELLMSKITSWLTDNGVLCIVTPDIGSLAARIFSNHWWHYRPAHLYYFNRKSISFLLNKHGYQVITIRHYVWHFSISYLLSRLKLKSYDKFLASVVIPLNLWDSMEIYARKK